MSATTELETFGTQVLEDISPFVVIFDETTSELKNRTTKDGRSYTQKQYSIVVESALYSKRLKITGVSEAIYTRMRLYRLKGVINLAVTRGIAPKEGGFAPYIVSGVPA